MNKEMLQVIDSISRERNLDKELLFADIEQAMVSAARKHFNALDTDEFSCKVDRLTGQIRIYRGLEEISTESLGRIPAQTAKQVMIQKFREDERASIQEEFSDRSGEIVTGSAQRYEGGTLVVQLGRAEGFMPRSEQIPGEQHLPGERVRCMIMDVREIGSQLKIIVSRSHPDFVRRLFEVEVPEVNERIIEIRALAREAGHRTKVAVSSIDSKVDAVGACVGVRGSRIKNIVDELGGEKIDIVRWNDSSQVLIVNALRPAEIAEISLCFELGRATVVVNEDQLSLAIGKRGQNVRLASRLTNWDVDILTPEEFAKGLGILEETLKGVEGITDEMLDRMVALGLITVFDIEEVGASVLVDQLSELEIKAELAGSAVNACSEKGKTVAVQQQKEKEEAARRKAQELEEPIDEADKQAAAVLGILGLGDGGESETSATDDGDKGEVEGEAGGDIVDMLIQGQSDEDQEEKGIMDVALAEENTELMSEEDVSPATEEIDKSQDETDVAKLAQGEEMAEEDDGEADGEAVASDNQDVTEKE